MFFHFTLSKSFSNGAQYVILHNKNLFDDEKSPKYDGLNQENSCTIRIYSMTKNPQNMTILNQENRFRLNRNCAHWLVNDAAAVPWMCRRKKECNK
jgi:hypothetical protein